MNDIQILIDDLVKFREFRHWEQYHNSRDLALDISIEASDLIELFPMGEKRNLNLLKGIIEGVIER